MTWNGSCEQLHRLAARILERTSEGENRMDKCKKERKTQLTQVFAIYWTQVEQLLRNGRTSGLQTLMANFEASLLT